MARDTKLRPSRLLGRPASDDAIQT
jgi:hypothetical protein